MNMQIKATEGSGTFAGPTPTGAVLLIQQIVGVNATVPSLAGFTGGI